MKDRARKHRWDGLHGEQHPHAKLTREAVDQIRTLYRQGSITQTALGEYFGVHQVTISAIVRGRTWR